MAELQVVGAKDEVLASLAASAKKVLSNSHLMRDLMLLLLSVLGLLPSMSIRELPLHLWLVNLLTHVAQNLSLERVIRLMLGLCVGLPIVPF